MNLSKIAVAALGFNYSPWFVQGEEKHLVGPYELHPIGVDTVGIGSEDPSRYALIMVHLDEGSVPTMEVRLHFEGDFQRENPIIEVFSGVEDGAACDTGTPTSIESRYDIISGGPLPDMRVTRNGAISQVVAYMGLYDSSRWTPLNGDSPELAGSFMACARVSMQHDGEYISFVDTTVEVHLDKEGTFQTSANDITVLGVVSKSLEDSYTTEIGLNSFLCGPSDSGNPNRPFKIGQSFSICVAPGVDAIAEYEHIRVVGFGNVQCGPVNVVEDGTPTPLSYVDTETTFPYKDADGHQVGRNVTSFETVVTPDYFTQGIFSDQTVTCSGTAQLSFEAPRFEKTGCRNIEEGFWDTAQIGYPSLDGGTEDDVKACNDYCRGLGKNYFILLCPFHDDTHGVRYKCLCPDDGGQQSDGLCSGSMQDVSHCTLDFVSRSDYEFGLDRTLDVPVYRVNQAEVDPGPSGPGEFRRLTTKFSINSGDLLQRDLQESSSSSFGTEVRLSRDNTDAIDDLEAPAARTAMASAAGALVVAAAALA